jgi:uncharacterized OB-fold protein
VTERDAVAARAGSGDGAGEAGGRRPPGYPQRDDPVIAKPLPVPTPTSQPYWDGLAHCELRLQHCDACGAWVHYPRHRCPVCLSDRLSWRTVDAAGTVYTFSVARRPTAPPFADEVPQIIAVVELGAGPHVTTTLVGVAAEDVRIGMPVTGVFDAQENGVTLLRFRPV